MINLTIEEINMLNNPDIAVCIKNNFAAKKLPGDVLVACNCLAMNAYQMLMTQYEEQETNEYQNKLVAAKYSNSR